MFSLDAEEYREMVGDDGVYGCRDKNGEMEHCGNCQFFYRCPMQKDDPLNITEEELHLAEEAFRALGKVI